MNRKEAGTNIRTHSGEHTHIYEKVCTNTKHAGVQTWKLKDRQKELTKDEV